MKALNNFFEIQTKSKKRIQDFGEVFTPEKYINQMLDMLDKSVWHDINKVFFEPTCGHGNFVVSILNRRLDAIFKQAKRKKIKSPEFYSVTNALDTLWAIDVDKENVNETRFRVLREILNFLTLHTNKTVLQLIMQKKVFFTHILCATDYHIHQNELITSFEKNTKEAKKKTVQTKVSKIWIKKGKHKPIDFNLTWVEYFKSKNAKVFEFEKKAIFIKNFLKKPFLKEEIFSESLFKNYFI